MSKVIRAKAPATVANVCCGFDILGFAVHSPCDEVQLTFHEGSEVLMNSISGDHGKLPLDAERNTATVAISSYLNAIDKRIGVTVDLYKHLPLGSGMGSSAASAAAALVAVNAYFGNPLSREALVVHAMEAERVACGAAHADNVAPSLMGGFVLVRNYQPLDLIRVPCAMEIYCTLVHPHLELRTEDARKVLKPSVTLKEAITQNGNTAGLIVGLMSGDYELIGRSLHDVIAEPIRSVFIPGFAAIKQKAKEAGALGAGISGSGPTMFALSRNKATAERVGHAMQQHFSSMELPSDVHVSAVNGAGATIIERES